MIARFKLLITVFLGMGVSLFGAQVRLVDKIAVHPPKVTLGQIAVIESADKLLQDRLIGLEITDPPRMGMTRTISAYKVKARLREEGLGDVIVKGVQTTVSLETRVVDVEELEAIVTDWIHAESESVEEVEVSVLRLPREWNVPAGNQVRIEVENPREQRWGNLTLTLRAMTANHVLSTQIAYVHVAAFRKMPVVVRAVRRGEVLGPQHIQLQRIEVTSSSGMEVMSLDEVMGMSSKRQMTVGYVPRATDLSRPVLVQRGEPVSIVVANGAIRMKVAGAIALQDGREGELIQFKNPMNESKPLRARIMGSGIAEMRVQ